MNTDDYVLDEKRGQAWGNSYDAMCWYRDQLDSVEIGWQPLETAPVGESVQLAYKLGLGTAIGHKGEDGIWRGHEGTVWGDGTARFSHWKPESDPPPSNA